MARAGLAALGAVFGGVPEARRGVATAYHAELEEERAAAAEGRKQGRYEMEQEKFEMLKEKMRADRNYIDNIYEELKSKPRYAQYAHLIKPEQYSKDDKGKMKATADIVTLERQVDEIEKAKNKFGILLKPDPTKSFEKWRTGELEPALSKARVSRVGKGLAMDPKAVGAPVPPGAEGPPQFEPLVQEAAEFRKGIGKRAPTGEEAYGVATRAGLSEKEAEQVSKGYVSEADRLKALRLTTPRPTQPKSLTDWIGDDLMARYAGFAKGEKSLSKKAEWDTKSKLATQIGTELAKKNIIHSDPQTQAFVSRLVEEQFKNPAKGQKMVREFYANHIEPQIRTILGTSMAGIDDTTKFKHMMSLIEGVGLTRDEFFKISDLDDPFIGKKLGTKTEGTVFKEDVEALVPDSSYAPPRQTPTVTHEGIQYSLTPTDTTKPTAPATGEPKVGTIYKNAKGQRARYLGNGKWQEIK